jgi:hypothetical protein
LIITDNDWLDRVKGLLKSELKKKGVSYRQLTEKLEELGVFENHRNIANKLARGGFSAFSSFSAYQQAVAIPST